MADIEPTERRSNAPQTIRAEIFGDDTAEACGVSVKSNAPILELCRRLIEAGRHPASPLEAWRGQTLALRVKTLAAGARLTVDENRMDYRPYRAFSHAPVTPPVSLRPASLLPPVKNALASMGAAALP